MIHRVQNSRPFSPDEPIPVPTSVACCPTCMKGLIATPISWNRLGEDGYRYKPDEYMLSCDTELAETEPCFANNLEIYDAVTRWLVEDQDVEVEFSHQELQALNGSGEFLNSPERICAVFQLRNESRD